ncbi:DUF397 domain-containing protein [Plantactinospora solaniradicis]|uniref:DUF397 domain-containing protein n=1 Tax=Plantactinospora solaniradicis TaxID=1723736 RepID=A0ABW1KEM3_9ACTN
MTEPTIPSWHKSTRSSNQGACVEVAGNLPGRVLVRDTKDRDGGILTFRSDAWRSFVAEPPRRS